MVANEDHNNYYWMPRTAGSRTAASHIGWMSGTPYLMRPEAAFMSRVRLVSVPCTGMDGNDGFKKLHDNLAADVDRAVEVIAADPAKAIARRATCRNSMSTGSASKTSCTFWAKLAARD